MRRIIYLNLLLLLCCQIELCSQSILLPLDTSGIMTSFGHSKVMEFRGDSKRYAFGVSSVYKGRFAASISVGYEYPNEQELLGLSAEYLFVRQDKPNSINLGVSANYLYAEAGSVFSPAMTVYFSGANSYTSSLPILYATALRAFQNSDSETVFSLGLGYLIKNRVAIDFSFWFERHYSVSASYIITKRSSTPLISE